MSEWPARTADDYIIRIKSICRSVNIKDDLIKEIAEVLHAADVQVHTAGYAVGTIISILSWGGDPWMNDSTRIQDALNKLVDHRDEDGLDSYTWLAGRVLSR